MDIISEEEKQFPKTLSRLANTSIQHLSTEPHYSSQYAAYHIPTSCGTWFPSISDGNSKGVDMIGNYSVFYNPQPHCPTS